ncbi:MAG: hypothetical protein AB8B58_18230 [Roseobacter sp.]
MMLPRISASLACLLWMTPAVADVSAADVWTDWQAYTNSFGMQITGTETPGADGLTVDDVVITTQFLEGTANVTVSVGTLLFQEASDGTVTVVLPDEFTSETILDFGAQGRETTQATYRQSGFVLVASGTPENLTYTFNGPEVSGESVTSISTAGSDELAVQTATFTLNNLAGENIAVLSDMREITTELTAERGSYALTYQDPNSDAQADIRGSATNLSASGQNTFPLLVQDDLDLSAQLAAGLSLTGDVTVGANSIELATQGPEPLDAIITSDTASIAFALGQDGLRYDVTQNATNMQLVADFLPAPMVFGISKTSFDFGLPVTPTEEPGDFGFGLTFDDFTMSDSIWAMLDPQAGLPRDPARLILEVSGKAKLLFDLLNPPSEQQMQAPDFTPAELQALNLNSLDISAVGARLTGAGGFTFEPPVAGSPLPRPTGTVDLELVGANGLLDTLVSMGLLPEQEAMGVRLMMGLLGVPGDAPDTITSKIEVNEQFQIFANGQRIQ